MADQEHLIARYPRLYHMAELGAWETIRRHGLLSTKALLKLFNVREPWRSAMESEWRRTGIVVCHPEYGCAAIRDQSPMAPSKLARALTNMDPPEWYKLLNGKVFFWSTESRLRTFLQAKSHMDRPHDVLTVCTRSLVEQHAAKITLSPINSGTVRSPKHTRGSDTFRTMADYRCRRGAECFVELAVEGGVLDMERHTLSLDRWLGATHQENIWLPNQSAT